MSELTETQERFLRDVAKRLPLERVGEAYVFAPMRQGGMETGVAVIAVALEAPAAPDAPDVPLAEEACTTVDERVHEALDEVQASVEGDVAPEAIVDPVLDAVDEAPDDAAGVVRASVLAAAEVDEVEVEEATVGDVEPVDAVTVDVEEAAAPATDAEPEPPDASQDTAALPAAEPMPIPPTRYTVFTARYRLQLKGPDRGKWEVDVVEEAEAPLLTVDAVVRGVQRRAGDEIEAERLTAADFLAVVDGQATWPATR